VSLALKRKVVARGAATFVRAGIFGFRLKLPARLRPGTYKLKIRFKPKGSSTASTKTVKIRFVSSARGSRAGSAVRARFSAN
jgi:hypothetical protein